MTIEHAEQNTDLRNLSYVPTGNAAPNQILEIKRQRTAGRRRYERGLVNINTTSEERKV